MAWTVGDTPAAEVHVRTLWIGTLAALVACGNGDGQDAGRGAADGVGPQGPPTEGTDDPDVDSWLPPNYVASQPTRLVILGDSISAGVGATRQALEYPKLLQTNASRVWSGFDDADLDTIFPSVTEVIDVSRGGATVPTLRAQQIPALEARLGATPAPGETIVVYTIGGNDAVGLLGDIGNIEANIGGLISAYGDAADEIRALFSDDVFLYVTNVYEPTDGTGESGGVCFGGLPFGLALPFLDDLNEGLRAEGEARDFAVVDLDRHFQGHGFNAADDGIDAYHPDDPTMWFEQDCIHPNDRGHHEVRRLFAAAIRGETLKVQLPE